MSLRTQLRGFSSSFFFFFASSEEQSPFLLCVCLFCDCEMSVLGLSNINSACLSLALHVMQHLVHCWVNCDSAVLGFVHCGKLQGVLMHLFYKMQRFRYNTCIIFMRHASLFKPCLWVDCQYSYIHFYSQHNSGSCYKLCNFCD